MGTLKLVSQQYRAWSDCTEVQAGLALYWWQRLIASGSSRIRVNVHFFRQVSNTSDELLEDNFLALFQQGNTTHNPYPAGTESD